MGKKIVDLNFQGLVVVARSRPNGFVVDANGKTRRRQQRPTPFNRRGLQKEL